MATGTLEQRVRGRFQETVSVQETFLQSNADFVARVCFELAARFRAGGRLVAFGEGAEASDAHHVAVEFVHPVLVGKEALAAFALPETRHTDGSTGFLTGLAVHGRPNDIAFGIARGPDRIRVFEALARAREMGMLTVLLTGGIGTFDGSRYAEHVFTVPSSDVMIVQEVQETLYHVIWELVHVFLNPSGDP